MAASTERMSPPRSCPVAQSVDGDGERLLGVLVASELCENRTIMRNEPRSPFRLHLPVQRNLIELGQQRLSLAEFSLHV